MKPDKKDIIIRDALSIAKEYGDPFETLSRLITSGKADPLLMKCKKRFENIKWLWGVHKDNGYFSSCARVDLIELGYLSWR